MRTLSLILIWRVTWIAFPSLFSFAKFLELLLYSPTICNLSPPLCEHTTPAPFALSPSTHNSSSLPTSRLNIVRHFASRSHAVSFSLSTIEDIFELRVPRLQIIRGNGDRSARNSMTKDDRTANDKAGAADEEKKTLRREIKVWWEGIADRMDKLVRTSPPQALDSK